MPQRAASGRARLRPVASTATVAIDPMLGRKILLNDVSVEVVGVMPEGFKLPTDFTAAPPSRRELWRPLQIEHAKPVRGSHG